MAKDTPTKVTVLLSTEEFERLDKELQRSVDAYKDPWKEAYAPVTANQFSSLLPILQ